ERVVKIADHAEAKGALERKRQVLGADQQIPADERDRHVPRHEGGGKEGNLNADWLLKRLAQTDLGRMGLPIARDRVSEECNADGVFQNGLPSRRFHAATSPD